MARIYRNLTLKVQSSSRGYAHEFIFSGYIAAGCPTFISNPEDDSTPSGPYRNLPYQHVSGNTVNVHTARKFTARVFW